MLQDLLSGVYLELDFIFWLLIFYLNKTEDSIPFWNQQVIIQDFHFKSNIFVQKSQPFGKDIVMKEIQLSTFFF